MICEMFLFLLFQLAPFLSSTTYGFVHSFSACFKCYYTPHIEVKFRRHYLRGCSLIRTPILIYLAPHINNSDARSLFPNFHKRFFQSSELRSWLFGPQREICQYYLVHIATWCLLLKEPSIHNIQPRRLLFMFEISFSGCFLDCYFVGV